MENKFEIALKKNELIDFFLGKGNYYIIDREYGEHSVLLSWNNYILPYLDKKGNINEIDKMFINTLENSFIDLYTKEEFLTYHLFVYYSLVEQKKFHLLKNKKK